MPNRMRLTLLLIALPVLGASGPSAAREAVSPVVAARAHRQAHGAEILARYAELLAIPNVASDLPNMRRNAAWIRDALTARGVEVDLWTLPDVPPVVFGRLDAPGATRTLGVYVHYDGQPVDERRWTDPPFQPTLRSAAIEDGGQPRPWPRPGEPIDPEWRIYARGSGDDKAPIPAILTALDALDGAGLAPEVNLIFLFEGEEEAGSTNLRRYLDDHREALDPVDVWLICDGPVHPSRRPQLVFGVRGYTGLDITVYGATRYLHSGHYGNWAPNPAMTMAQLLASMKDDAGDVVIPGFYDSTEPIGALERRAIDALPSDGPLRVELGLARTEGDGTALAERIRQPSLNIRGLESAAVGERARNVIPKIATASIDIRLVRGNDPEAMLDLVEAHVRREGFFVVRDDPDLETRLAHAKIARIDRRPGYPAAGADLDDPRVRDIVEAARRVAGDELVLLPTLGGSLPLYLFTEVLGKPVIIVPIANHDDNQHAPDENLRLANLWYGIELMASLFHLPDSR